MKHSSALTSSKPRVPKSVFLMLGLISLLFITACNQAPKASPKAKDPRVTYDLIPSSTLPTSSDTFQTLGVTQGNGITVTFEKTAQWGAGSGTQGFTGYVTLLNQTGKSLNDWDLTFEFPFTINQTWGAKLSTASAAADLINPGVSNTFKFVPESWNATLEHGQSRSFGFNGSFSETFVEPGSYVLSGIPVGGPGLEQPMAEVCILETRYQLNSSWENGDGTNGFVAELYVTNTGELPVNWELAFDYDATLTNMWNATFTQEESRYTLVPNDWNTRLEPGATRAFGFQGLNEGVLGEPYNFVCSVPGAENALPSLSISSGNDVAFEPDAEVEFTIGEEGTLTATATDFEDGDLSEQVVWTYTPEGQEVTELGEGASINLMLPEGAGTLTATVSDSAGETVSFSLSVSVLPAKPDRFLDVTGSATCSLRPEGGSFNANLLFTDAEGKFVNGEVEPTSLSFTNLKVLAADGSELTNATLNVDSVLTSSGSDKTASILILLDQSGSITGFDRDGKRFEAARALIERLEPGDEAAIGIYYRNGLQVLQPFTTDKESLYKVVDNSVRNGDSSVYSSLSEAASLFSESSGAVKAVITITDGESFGDTLKFSNALEQLNAQGVKVFPVGVRTRSNTIDYYFQYLKWTACSTQGVFTELDEPGGFDAIFTALSNELIADVTPLATTLQFDTDLPDTGSYMLQGNAEVIVDGRSVSKDISISFDLEPAIPGRPIITSITPSSGPTQSGNRIRRPQITLSGDNLFPYWQVELTGQLQSGAGSKHEPVDSIRFSLALVNTSLAGPQPLMVATPFGVSDPVDFTFIAEYKPTVESFSVDSPSPTVGDTITYSWQVDDLAGDAISCEVQTNDLTIYKIEDCRATTSQTHTFTALPSNAYSYLRLADENALTAAKQLRVNVQPSAPAPVLELLSPDRGPADGGNTITITGQNLTGTSRVMFDGADATDFNVDSDTQITATVVRGVNSDYVTVFVPEGGTSNRLTYKYVRTPIISSLSPAEGLPGDTVTVSGSYIGDVEAVNVGAQAAQFTIVATNKLTFVVPEGEPGLFDVTLSAVGETSAAKSFTYLEKPVPTPILNTISPDKGSSAGGTNVTLSGKNLADALSVTFGGQDVSFTQDSDTQVTVSSPAGTDAAEITVTTAGGKSNALSFNYIEPPVLTGISPNEGPTAGGTEVTLTGENLSDATEVRFGNIVSQSFAAVSDTKIVAVSPRGQEGTFGITVSNLDDTSDTLRFTYIKPLTQIPEIRSFEISPSISVVGEDVKVTWLVEDPDSTSLTCKLVFDNTTKVIDDCINTSTESYTFSQSGDFSISLEVSDGENTNSITKDISIADLPTPELSDFTDAEVATAWNVVENTPEFNRLSLNAETSEGVAWKTQGYVMMYLPEVGSYRYIQALVLDGVAVDILRHSFDINARTVTISHILSGIGVTLQVDELASMSVDALATQLLPFYQHSAFTTSRISTPSSFIQTQSITACPQCDDKIIDYGKKAKAAANFSSNLLLNTLYVATPAYVLMNGFAPVPVCGILISGALGSACSFGFTAAALFQFTRYMIASGAAYKSYFAVKDCFTICQPNYQIGRGPIAIATPPLPIVRTSFVQSLSKASSAIIGQGPGQTEDDVWRLLSQPSIINAASSAWEVNAQFDNAFIEVCRTYPDAANRVMGADWATSCN